MMNYYLYPDQSATSILVQPVPMKNRIWETWEVVFASVLILKLKPENGANGKIRSPSAKLIPGVRRRALFTNELSFCVVKSNEL